MNSSFPPKKGNIVFPQLIWTVGALDGVLEWLLRKECIIIFSLENEDERNGGDGRCIEFEQGRAEAFGALCRIFCSQRSGNVLPVYLSRFYFSVCAGMLYDKVCKTWWYTVGVYLLVLNIS